MLRPIVVVKVGSSVVAHDSPESAAVRFEALAFALREVADAGFGVVFVLSGAVATGKTEAELPSKQARAARGQWILNSRFEQAAARAGVRCALALLTRHEFASRERYHALREAVRELTDQGYVVVANENDAVVPEGTNDFPDNDHLAAILAVSVQAEQLLMLTNVEGIYSGNPNVCMDATLIEEVRNVNAPLIDIARGKQSALGRGGMPGKLRAARLATAMGIPTHIVNGNCPNYITDIIVRHERRGTFCHPRNRSVKDLSARERWLLSAQNTGSSIEVDDGAVAALRARKSLLAVGVRSVIGAFGDHDVVEIVDRARDTVAVGATGVTSRTLERMIASDGNEKHGVEIVHADNMILFES